MYLSKETAVYRYKKLKELEALDEDNEAKLDDILNVASTRANTFEEIAKNSTGVNFYDVDANLIDSSRDAVDRIFSKRVIIVRNFT